MTQPPQSPQPAVVEWGGERTGMLYRLTSFRGWHPALPWALACLGAVAMFGSLVGEWQVMERSFVEVPSQDTVGIETLGLAYTFVWGMGWVVGGMLLAVCGGLTLAGQPSIRQYARTVGLAVAGVDVGFLAAAAVNLEGESVFAGGVEGVEISLGRGVYAAFASVALIGVALYLARDQPTRRRVPEAEPPAPEGPPDLTVGPAEPTVRPTDTLAGQ